MPAPTNLLHLQFLDWVATKPRTYAEAMEAWRSSCPRLTVWEDALFAGLIEVQESGTLRQAEVTLTEAGKNYCENHKANALINLKDSLRDIPAMHANRAGADE